jgi:putative ABC transport system ATP-binding protein
MFEVKKMGIEFRNITKLYHKGESQVEALNNVTFTINNGEFLALTGVSGSGKSTLLSLIGGLDLPTTGEIIVDGVDLSELNSDELADYRRIKVGFIFQSFNLIPTLNILENVMLPLVPIKMSARERKGIAMMTIKEVNLEERINHLPGELSGGEQQRVAIARALVNNPSIILADEPTGDLDTKTGEKITLLLKKLKYEKNCTVIIATHDPKIAELTEKRIVFEDGKYIKEVISELSK